MPMVEEPSLLQNRKKEVGCSNGFNILGDEGGPLGEDNT